MDVQVVSACSCGASTMGKEMWGGLTHGGSLESSRKWTVSACQICCQPEGGYCAAKVHTESLHNSTTALGSSELCGVAFSADLLLLHRSRDLAPVSQSTS